MTIYRGVGGSGDSATGEDVFGDNGSITSLNGISGAIQTPTYIKFAPDANHTASQGELTWNTAEGTLDLGLNHGGVVLQIGQELHYRVTNQSGSNIANGVLVSFVGTTGNSGKLLIAPFDGSQPSKTILGLTTEPINNGENGYVTCFGKVRGIQTNGANYGETWVDGDILYPSPTGLTKVLPQAPAAKQPIAVVVNAHGTNGELFVRVQSGTTLAEDELVQLASLTDGDILQYNATSGRFENTALPLGSGTVTSVDMSVPIGLAISGNPITSSGTLALTYDTGYSIPTNASQSNWDTAYSWGNHATANYLDTADIGVSVQGYDANTAKYDDVTANFTGTLQNGGSNVVVDSDIGSSVLAYDSNLQSFVNTFTLPSTDGTVGQVLTTDGSGTLQFSNGGGDLTDYIENTYPITYTDLGVLSTSITLDITKKWNIGEFTGSDTTYTINGISPTVSTLEPAHFTFINNGSVTKTVSWDTNLFSIAGSTLSQITLPIGYKVDFDVRRNPLNPSESYEVKVGDVNYNQSASGLATTWNPSDAASAIILSNSNKSVTRTQSGGLNYSGVRSFGGKDTGKWRFALRCDAILASGTGGSTTSIVQIGITTPGVNLSQTIGMGVAGGYALLTYNSSANAVLNAVYGVLVDFDLNKAWATVNGAVVSGDPEAGTGGTGILDNQVFFPCVFMKTASSGGNAGLFTLINELEDIYSTTWPSFRNWTA